MGVGPRRPIVSRQVHNGLDRRAVEFADRQRILGQPWVLRREVVRLLHREDPELRAAALERCERGGLLKARHRRGARGPVFVEYRVTRAGRAYLEKCQRDARAALQRGSS